MPLTSAHYDLVIFDCDGVLVDSELLSARVLMDQLAEIGIDLSFENFRTFFLGRKFAVATANLENRLQRKLPENFQSMYFDTLLIRFETELKPMMGVTQVLNALSADSCVASSSLPVRLNCALRVCGLEPYFAKRVYSASLVANAKPAPDLFLHASHLHGFEPSRCLVIEDSEMGVMAAHAANMDVWHFTGGEHIKAGYELPPHLKVQKVVANMQELHLLFCEAGLSHG